ncbi:MAG: hypothetical protein COU27_02135 [Candidatus Levybacteria bacterium CG10_big_fil_rev_8_21_14_0_10_36_7]|nr:MAG: hypothetical protein COU27_02135 [Candidatus Levybacteria bacterium CG10_big_fil_rev_8_21_14_0_10_36_7]
MKKRFFCDLLLIVCFVFLPWYILAVLVVVFMFLFKKFWEGVVVALFIDALYSVPSMKFYGRFWVFTLASVVLLFLIERFKKELRV